MGRQALELLTSLEKKELQQGTKVIRCFFFQIPLPSIMQEMYLHLLCEAPNLHGRKGPPHAQGLPNASKKPDKSGRIKSQVPRNPTSSIQVPVELQIPKACQAEYDKHEEA